MKKRSCIITIIFFVSIFLFNFGQAQQTGITVQSIPSTIDGGQISEQIQRLTPDQKQAIEEVIKKKSEKVSELKGVTEEEKEKAVNAIKKEEKIKIQRQSLFYRFRDIGKYQDIPLDLKPFGYDFFQTATIQVIKERRDIPVPLKYVIGPGDEVRILLWGRVNAQYNLVVDRDGKITIPQIGPIFVAGKTFEDMSKEIIKQAEQIVGTNVDVTLGALKTIPIFVLGDVQRPGAYTIGSTATITDALLLAGGPTEIGSMRNIQLRRKDKIVATLDLYDLFLRGDKSKDATLMAGDVVFVPVTGPLIGIAGHVKRPAIYELRDRRDLMSLLELAGGIIPSAYTQQIQVERIIKNERQTVIDINDKDLSKARTFILEDGDLIKIFPIVHGDRNIVFLIGNVARPGKYEYKRGMRIRDILNDPEKDLLPETHLDYALIKRQEPPLMQTALLPVNLKAAIIEKDEKNNIEIKPMDQIFIFNKWFFEEKPYVIVEGEIRGECNASQGAIAEEKPIDLNYVLKSLGAIEDDLSKRGKFNLTTLVKDISTEIKAGQKPSASKLFSLRLELQKMGESDHAARIIELETRSKAGCRVKLEENLRVRDAIMASGGVTHESYMNKAHIIRKDRNGKYYTVYFNLEEALRGNLTHNLLLEKNDRIIIHSIQEHEYRKYVVIEGEVTKPGSYQFTEGMKVKDLLFKGGNILESAYLDEAELVSIIVVDGKIAKTEKMVINLRKALAEDPKHNVPLKPNDRLFVKRIPDWGAIKYVTLTGEFKFPGRYAIHKGERLSSVIERAGGYLPTAYLRGAYFTRESVRALQQKSLEEMTRRLERELLSEASARIGSSLTPEEVQSKAQEIQFKQRLIDFMRGLKATGRMSISLTNLRLFKGSIYDIELEDGDTLHLPQKNNVVNVVGAVMAETSHVFNEKWSYLDYINASGGMARYADADNIFVLKVDGSARKLSGGLFDWNEHKGRWELASYREDLPKIEPGDVIMVPEKVTTIAWLREIRDITQILMNTAVTAATIIKLW